MSPHQNIHKQTRTSPDGKTRHQLDHIFTDKIWLSSIRDLRDFKGSDCGAEHYLVAANVRERLLVSKQAAQKFDVERFNFRKLNEVQVSKNYHTEISNKLAAMEYLSDSKIINTA